jgi:hypothetical protein
VLIIETQKRSKALYAKEPDAAQVDDHRARRAVESAKIRIELACVYRIDFARHRNDDYSLVFTDIDGGALAIKRLSECRTVGPAAVRVPHGKPLAASNFYA